MKICHITSSHQRYDGRIFQKECVSLAKKYDVSLLCSDTQSDEVKDNVKIISLGVSNKGRKNRFFVIPRLLKKKAIELNCDIYHLHDPELISLAAYLKKKGKIVIFDSHEDNVNRIDDRTWIPSFLRPAFKRFYASKEKRVLSKIDAVVSVTPHIVDRLKKINKNTCMITNYPIVDNKKFIKKFDNYICFAGGITKLWNHGNIINSLDDFDISYKIAGDISDSYLEELKLINNFSKVDLLGKLSHNDVIKLYESASIGIALCEENSNVDYHNGSLGNTKLFEYMASGVPIICTNFVLWEKIIKKYDCGICVNPNNIEEIHNAIKLLLTDKDLQKKYSKNGIIASKKEFNWSIQEKILYELYDKVIKKGEK